MKLPDGWKLTLNRGFKSDAEKSAHDPALPIPNSVSCTLTLSEEAMALLVEEARQKWVTVK